ncbi:glycosyltransferase [Aquipuribacter hungaricus]|uniref:Glycosyltransferase n=1 Tax=Aquipuribacter hungaricus TaxID=545624 RepID=A0ABV7WCX0_9MICO
MADAAARTDGGADDGARGAAGGRPLRVLAVDERLHEDGAARLALRLLQLWTAAGADAPLFLLKPPGGSRPGPPVPDGVRLLHRRARTTGGRARVPGLRKAETLLQLWRAVRGADVVLAAREIDQGLVLGRLVALVARRPFVVLVQSDPHMAMAHHVRPRSRPLVRWCLRTATHLVCVSPGLLAPLASLGVPAGRTTAVSNGVDVEAVLRAGAGTPPELPAGDGPLVLGLGRLVHQKGFDLLVRAHARVVSAGVPHRLLVLGDGAERERLLALADELGVTGSVSLPGFTADPLPTLAAADLYCLPSRWEGQPLTLAEAMVLGTPAVAADCVSGPREMLADGTRGDLVPVEDVDALAAAVRRHLEDPSRLRAAATEGRAWAREHLDDRRFAAGVMDVLVGQARRRG